MSRTIRRKNTSYNDYLTLGDWKLSNGIFQPFIIDRNSLEGKKLLAKYHSDHGFGDYSHACPPRWYRKLRNKTSTMREKQYVAKWMKNPDYEVPKFVRVSDAPWFW